MRRGERERNGSGPNQGRNLVRFVLFVVIELASGRTGGARAGVEAHFWPREAKTHSSTPPTKPAPESRERTVSGETLVYQPEKGDTFFHPARNFNLGYNELLAATPGADEWIPGHFDK